MPDAPDLSRRPSGSIWRAPLLAFFSGRFYADIGVPTRRFLEAPLYLAVLQIVTWTVSGVLSYSAVADYMKGPEAEEILTQVPPIAIRKGVVTVDAPQPHFITLDEDAVQKAIVLDTTGEIDSIEDRPEVVALLTENKLHLRRATGQIQIHDLSGVESFDTDADMLRDLIERLSVPVMVVGLVIAIGFAFVYRLVQALVVAGIGMILAGFMRRSLAFGSSFRLAIAAMTPIIIVDSALGWASVTQASGFVWWIVCFAATLCFMAFAVASQDESSAASRS